MRQSLALACGVLAALALLVALPTWWVSDHVADEDGFVALASETLDDEQVRTTTSALVTDELQHAVAQQAAARGLPAPDLSAVGAELVDTVLSSDVARRAWTDTVRGTHQNLFGDPESAVPSGYVVIDLTSLVEVLADKAGVGVFVPPVVRSWHSSTAAEVAQWVEQAADVWPIAGAVALASAVAAVALARRRSAAVLWLGGGIVAVAAVVWVLGRLVPLTLDDVSDEPLVDDLVVAIADVGIGSLTTTVVWVAVGGAVVAAAGGVGRAIARR